MHKQSILDNTQTVEIGWSAGPGQQPQQKRVREYGEAYERDSWKKVRGSELEQLTLHRLLPLAWEVVERRFPDAAKKMLHEAGRYGLLKTGFVKISLGYDNPTVAQCAPSPASASFELIRDPHP